MQSLPMSASERSEPQCRLCDNVSDSGVVAKASVLGCGHKICTKCLSSRIRIIQMDKLMVVKCPIEGCTAITAKPLPKKYCADSPREKRVEVHENVGRRSQKPVLFPTQPGMDDDNELTSAFDAAQSSNTMFAVGFSRRINMQAVFRFLAEWVQKFLAVMYAVPIIAIILGLVAGFERGYAHTLVESLNNGVASLGYPLALALLFLGEAVLLDGRPAVLIRTVDAALIAALAYLALSATDFSYCHSLDRYLVMSVTTYYLPLLLTGFVAVEILSVLIRATAELGACMHRLRTRLLGSSTHQGVSSYSTAEQLGLVGDGASAVALHVAAPAVAGSPAAVNYYPRRHAVKQAAILMDSDLTVRCSSYAQDRGTPTKDVHSSAEASPRAHASRTGNGAKRRVSFSLTPEKSPSAGLESNTDSSETEAIPGQYYGELQPADVVASTSADAAQSITSTYIGKERDKYSASPIPSGDAAEPDDTLVASFSESQSGEADPDLHGGNISSDDELDTAGNLCPLDTAPRILSGAVPRGYRLSPSPCQLRGPAAHWRVSSVSPTDHDDESCVNNNLNADVESTDGPVSCEAYEGPNKAVDAAALQSYAASPAEQLSTSLVLYDPSQGSFLSRYLDGECATPTEKYRYTTAGSDAGSSGTAGHGVGGEHCATDDTALMHGPSLSSATPRTPQQLSQHLPQTEITPSQGRASTPNEGEPGCFDSPEDDFKLHSNIKLKPLGTFSAGSLHRGPGGRRPVVVCDLSTTADTPVEGYTNACLVEASRHHTAPDSPPSQRTATAPAVREPDTQAAEKPQKPAAKSKSGVPPGDKRPLFKTVFLGRSGKGGIIR
jgi:hypothetical protein